MNNGAFWVIDIIVVRVFRAFCDQESLTLYGFSDIPILLNINSLINKLHPILYRCVFDPYQLPLLVTLPHHLSPPCKPSQTLFSSTAIKTKKGKNKIKMIKCKNEFRSL